MRGRNGRRDSRFVAIKFGWMGEASSTHLCTGTPPAGPQVSTANGNLTITATDNARPTNSGGVYGHTLTFSEPGSNNLSIITHADPTGLLVATPVEGDPSVLSVREYKGY
jgi:hypothetical protein